MNKCEICYKENAGLHLCKPQILTLQEFKEKCLNERNFLYLGWEIFNLYNWEGDGKTCIAGRGNTRIRDTEELVYNYISKLGK